MADKCKRRQKKFSVNYVALKQRFATDQRTQLSSEELKYPTGNDLKKWPRKRLDTDYGSLKLLIIIYCEIDRMKLVRTFPERATMRLVIDLGRLFLNSEMRTTLVNARAPCSLPNPEKVGMVDQDRMKQQLSTILSQTNVAENKIRALAIKSVLKALQEQKSLELNKLAIVINSLAISIQIPLLKSIKLLRLMIMDRLIAPDEICYMMNKYVKPKEKFTTPTQLVNALVNDFVVKQDGKVVSKRSMKFAPLPKPDIEEVEVIATADNKFLIVPRRSKLDGYKNKPRTPPQKSVTTTTKHEQDDPEEDWYEVG